MSRELFKSAFSIIEAIFSNNQCENNAFLRNGQGKCENVVVTVVQEGVDINTVKDLLGHKDLRMTVRYCHLTPENLSEAVKVLDAKESGYVLATLGQIKRAS